MAGGSEPLWWHRLDASGTRQQACDDMIEIVTA
jgi:hypothetical protein